MNHRTNRRGHSLAIAALAALTIAGTAGCSSGSDGDSAEAPAGTSADATLAPADTTAPADEDAGTDTSGTTSSDGGDSESASSAECGGLTAAAVGAAVGAGDFDSASDISVDADTTCLFSNSMSAYGVTVSKESASSYLAGDLDGASTDGALSALELALTTGLDETTVTRTDIGGHAAIVVTGTAITGGPAGAAGTVIDGVVVIVDGDGSELAADAAGFEPIMTNLLALAASS